MKKPLILFALASAGFLHANVSIGQPSIQKVRVTLHSIVCKNADDHGGSEELYGKIWALNLQPYKTESMARQYFDNNEIMKVGDGSGEIWSTSRNQLVVLKTGQTRAINKSIEMICRPLDNLIILGDLDERDYRNADDKLMSEGSIERKVISLSEFSSSYQFELVFKSGKTDVRAVIELTKIHN